MVEQSAYVQQKIQEGYVLEGDRLVRRLTDTRGSGRDARTTTYERSLIELDPQGRPIRQEEKALVGPGQVVTTRITAFKEGVRISEETKRFGGGGRVLGTGYEFYDPQTGARLPERKVNVSQATTGQLIQSGRGTVFVEKQKGPSQSLGIEEQQRRAEAAPLVMGRASATLQQFQRPTPFGGTSNLLRTQAIITPIEDVEQISQGPSFLERFRESAPIQRIKGVFEAAPPRKIKDIEAPFKKRFIESPIGRRITAAEDKLLVTEISEETREKAVTSIFEKQAAKRIESELVLKYGKPAEAEEKELQVLVEKIRPGIESGKITSKQAERVLGGRASVLAERRKQAALAEIPVLAEAEELRFETELVKPFGKDFISPRRTEDQRQEFIAGEAFIEPFLPQKLFEGEAKGARGRISENIKYSPVQIPLFVAEKLGVTSPRERLLDIGVGGGRGLRTEPIKTAGVFAITTAATVTTAGLTSFIPAKVVAGPLFKATTTVLSAAGTGYVVGTTAGRIALEPTISKKFEKFGEIAATEIIPLGAGAVAGAKLGKLAFAPTGQPYRQPKDIKATQTSKEDIVITKLDEKTTKAIITGKGRTKVEIDGRKFLVKADSKSLILQTGQKGEVFGGGEVKIFEVGPKGKLGKQISGTFKIRSELPETKAATDIKTLVQQTTKIKGRTFGTSTISAGRVETATEIDGRRFFKFLEAVDVKKPVVGGAKKVSKTFKKDFSQPLTEQRGKSFGISKGGSAELSVVEYEDPAATIIQRKGFSAFLGGKKGVELSKDLRFIFKQGKPITGEGLPKISPATTTGAGATGTKTQIALLRGLDKQIQTSVAQTSIKAIIRAEKGATMTANIGLKKQGRGIVTAAISTAPVSGSLAGGLTEKVKQRLLFPEIKSGFKPEQASYNILRPGLSTRQQERLITTQRQEPVLRQAARQRPTTREMQGTIQTPVTRITPALRQIPELRIITEQRLTPPFRPPTIGISVPIIPPTIPFTPFLPPDLSGGRSFGRGRPARRLYKASPTFAAIELGIRGKGISKATGFEFIRPIPTGKTKKKARKKEKAPSFLNIGAGRFL